MVDNDGFWRAIMIYQGNRILLFFFKLSFKYTFWSCCNYDAFLVEGIYFLQYFLSPLLTCKKLAFFHAWLFLKQNVMVCLNGQSLETPPLGCNMLF